MATWTAPADVLASWIGEDAPDSVEEQAVIEVWLGRAERFLRREVSDLQERIDAGEVDLLETAKDVVVSMVIRLFRNPDGARTRQETAGSYSGMVSYAGETPGQLYIEARELASLTMGTRGTAKVNSFTMIPPGSYFHPSNWPTT